MTNQYLMHNLVSTTYSMLGRFNKLASVTPETTMQELLQETHTYMTIYMLVSITPDKHGKVPEADLVMEKLDSLLPLSVSEFLEFSF